MYCQPRSAPPKIYSTKCCCRSSVIISFLFTLKGAWKFVLKMRSWNASNLKYLGSPPRKPHKRSVYRTFKAINIFLTGLFIKHIINRALSA
jgi:hypothetical protein